MAEILPKIALSNYQTVRFLKNSKTQLKNADADANKKRIIAVKITFPIITNSPH